MHGTDEQSGALLSYADLEARVPRQHPLREIRGLVNATLAALDGEFSLLYTSFGRPSIAPELLLRALLLQAFYSIRSERQLMERLEFDLLFRWFIEPGIDDTVWDHSVFSKNRGQLLESGIVAKFLVSSLTLPPVKRLLSSEHFSVDSTLIDAWASLKSVKPRTDQGDNHDQPPTNGGHNAEADFKGENRSN
jgi:transposase